MGYTAPMFRRLLPVLLIASFLPFVNLSASTTAELLIERPPQSLRGESIDLESLLFVVALEFVFAGAQIGGLFRKLGNLSAEFFCFAPQALELDLRGRARLQKSRGYPTLFSLCGSDSRPAFAAGQDCRHVARHEVADDPILRAGTGTKRQVDISIRYPGFLSLAGGC